MRRVTVSLSEAVTLVVSFDCTFSQELSVPAAVLGW